MFKKHQKLNFTFYLREVIDFLVVFISYSLN